MADAAANVLRFIGDVHQSYDDYLPLIRDVAHSIQVGDLGFDYSYLRSKAGINWKAHRFLGGNHDNYQQGDAESYWVQPSALGDYGPAFIPTMAGPRTLTVADDYDGKPVRIFFVRGGWSIDHKYLTPGLDYWPEEELDLPVLDRAVREALDFRPRIMVTHEAPISVVKHVTNPLFVHQFGYDTGVIPTRTNQALQRILDEHRPEYWIFGHYHRPWRQTIDGTTFICLDTVHTERDKAGSYFDLPLAD